MATALSTISNEIRVANGEDDAVTSANSLVPDAFVLTFTKDFYTQYGKDVRVEAGSTGSITLVDGTTEYSLASDFLLMKENPYFENANGERTHLQGPRPVSHTIYNKSTTKGSPIEFYLTEMATTKIGFIPTPDSTAGTVYYRYYIAFTAPTLISANFAMPDEFMSPFKLYGLYRASMRQKQFMAANGFFSEFEREMRRAKVIWRRRILSQDASWRQIP